MTTSLNSSPLYRVALIGKPNVGKSSLFNQLTGTNNAIVTAKRGVTRDTLNTVVKYQNDAMLLSDLAGWDTNFFERVDVTASNRDEVTLGKKMSSKIDETLENCDLLVVVLDLKDITAEDYQLKTWLEGISQPKVICVNKFDRDKDAAYLGEIYELFQEEMVLVSAKNKLKLNELKKKIFAEKAKLFAAGIKPRNSETSQREYDYTLSIVGRPNAGKSSLLNALLQKERAIVSDIAGTTRDIIHDYFEYHHKVFKILDTAGLKKKAKVKSRLENYANQKTIHAVNQSDLTILLVDAMVGITDQDKKIISFCKTKRKAMLVVINKWDLVKDKEQVDYFKYLLDIEPLLNKFPLLKVSCKNRRNFSKILENVYHLLKKQSIELATHDLNTTIQSATSRKAPPNKNGRSLKIYYAVQSLNSPPKLLLYVNSSSLVNKTYDSYLHNFIEKHYGLQGVPFSLSYVDKAEQAEK